MPDFSRNIAILIAVNDYANGVPILKTPCDDIAALKRVLIDYYFETPREIKQEEWATNDTIASLPETGDLIFNLTNAEAGYDNLVRLFKKVLPKVVTKESRLLLYYAGHGYHSGIRDGEDGRRPEGYLLPADAEKDNLKSYIRFADIYDWLKDLSCRHCLIVFDCCFAGAFRWGAYTTRAEFTPPPLTDIVYNRMTREKSWRVITSATQSQLAVDVAGGFLGTRGQAEGVRNSPFAKLLLEALTPHEEGVLPADSNADGFITVRELVSYIELKMHDQSPDEFPLPNDNGGMFIFRPKGSPDPVIVNRINPYLGLDPYKESYGGLFYGREDDLAALYRKVMDSPLVVVTGGSGTGKSSLVRAGLLWRLQEYRPKLADWYKLQAGISEAEQMIASKAFLVPNAFRPGSDPEKMLADALTSVNLSLDTPLPEGVTLILTVDQAEELITLRPVEARRNERKDTADAVTSAFLDRLLTYLWKWADVAGNSKQGKVRVILTVRNDFESEVKRLCSPPLLQNPREAGASAPVSPDSWETGRYLIPSLAPADLEAIVVAPAASQGVLFTSLLSTDRLLSPNNLSLVDTLVEDVNRSPGALPLLSYTLSQMFDSFVQRAGDETAAHLGRNPAQAGDDDRINWDDYRATGGVIDSLQTRAEAIYRGFGDPDAPESDKTSPPAETPDKAPGKLEVVTAHQRTMRRLMLRMVATEGGEFARRRVFADEFDYPQLTSFSRDDFPDLGLLLNWLEKTPGKDEPTAKVIRERLHSFVPEWQRRLKDVPPGHGWLAKRRREWVGRAVRSEIARKLNAWLEEKEGVDFPFQRKDRDQRRDVLEDACPFLRCERARVRAVKTALEDARLIMSDKRAREQETAMAQAREPVPSPLNTIS